MVINCDVEIDVFKSLLDVMYYIVDLFKDEVKEILFLNFYLKFIE